MNGCGPRVDIDKGQGLLCKNDRRCGTRRSGSLDPDLMVWVLRGAGSNQGRRSMIGRLTRFARGSGGDRSPELCSAAGGRRGWPIRRPRGRFGLRLGSGACPWHAQATGALRGEDWGAGRCERRRWRANAAEFAGASVLGDARGYGPRTLTSKGPGEGCGFSPGLLVAGDVAQGAWRRGPAASRSGARGKGRSRGALGSWTPWVGAGRPWSRRGASARLRCAGVG